MKKFFNKFFRKDLELNKKWWHRAIKVVRFITLIITIIALVSEFKPDLNGEIVYKWTIIDRVTWNWYYKINSLLKDDEYRYHERLSEHRRDYKTNKEILENSNPNVNLFCSNNWDSNNFDSLCEKYNLNVLDNSWFKTNTHLFEVYKLIKKPCICISAWNGDLVINYQRDFLDVWWYVYSINKPNYVTLYLTWFWKTILTMVIVILLSLLLYYNWIIYIIYWWIKKKK